MENLFVKKQKAEEMSVRALHSNTKKFEETSKRVEENSKRQQQEESSIMENISQKVDSIFEKMGQGFAKAIQKVDNQIFHDFPECSFLGGANTHRLSIKLKDQRMRVFNLKSDD